MSAARYRTNDEVVARDRAPRLGGVRLRVLAQSRRTGALTCELLEDSPHSLRWTRGSLVSLMPYEVDRPNEGGRT